jgi:hypothetical protein
LQAVEVEEHGLLPMQQEAQEAEVEEKVILQAMVHLLEPLQQLQLVLEAEEDLMVQQVVQEQVDL